MKYLIMNMNFLCENDRRLVTYALSKLQKKKTVNAR